MAQQQKLKIAVLAPIELANPGGVEAHILQISRALRQLGTDVDVFAKNPGPDYRAFRDFAADSYDVIHTHGSIFSPRFIPFALRLLDCQRHVHTLHGVSIDYLLACKAWLNWRCYTATAVEAVCSWFADRVIAVSESTARRAQKSLLLSHDKITVIPNGFTPAPPIDHQTKNQTRAAMGISPDDFVLLFVGRGEDPVKGTDVLTHALHTLAAKHPNLRLLAAPGTGFPDAPWLHRTGPVPLADMPRYYAAADIFVNTSLNEGMPLTVIEALASGLPVIAAPVGGIPEIITCGYNGLLLNPDRSNLADRIEQACLDPGLRQLLAHNAPLSVANLTWPILAQRTLDLYHALFA